MNTARCIGIDFDNTIVCCDPVFFNVAREMAFIPAAVAPRKELIRDYIKSRLTNDEWTLLQAEVYGPRLLDAEPYPGALDFIAACLAQGSRPRIISHKGRYPAAARTYDLHDAALQWLRQHDFFYPGAGLPEEDVTFAPTRLDKLEQIRLHGCAVFIDDLPEVFAEPTFPAAVTKVLFDPHDACQSWRGGHRATSWDEVGTAVFANVS